MAWKRMVLEIGMGTDIRGADHTKAAVRALRDALWHNSLSVANAVGLPTDSMRVEVTIGVPKPDPGVMPGPERRDLPGTWEAKDGAVTRRLTFNKDKSFSESIEDKETDAKRGSHPS